MNKYKVYIENYRHILEKMIQGMTDAEVTDSISHNFIVRMIPHHEAAIEMSKNILKYIDYIPLQDIAVRIVAEQTKSIENMRAVLEKCSELKNSSENLKSYARRNEIIFKEMFCQMKRAYSDNRLSCDFMREMIPHHRGAVRMAKNALRFNICPELKPILQKIIASQEKGIKEMQKLLTVLQCKV